MGKRRRSNSTSVEEAKTEEPLIPEPTNESDESEEEAEVVEESDSEEEAVAVIEEDSDDELHPLDENTVGDVPMHWYDEYDHIGYNIVGEKIARPVRKDLMDSFLDREDDSNWYTFNSH